MEAKSSTLFHVPGCVWSFIGGGGAWGGMGSEKSVSLSGQGRRAEKSVFIHWKGEGGGVQKVLFTFVGRGGLYARTAHALSNVLD